jgi:aconitase B
MDYEDKKTIARRIQAMQKWLDAPELLTADDNAEYAATIEINLDDPCGLAAQPKVQLVALIGLLIIAQRL